MTHQKIADKIRKIIAKANSTTSETEADTFMAKAHAMLEEHGISLLDLGRLDSDNPIGHDLEAFTSSDGFKDKFADQLARYYGCEIIFVPFKRASKTYTVFGRESARITFTLMMPFVAKQVARMALQAYKEGRYPTANKARTEVANALAVRLFRMNNDRKASTKHSAATSNALVPVDMIQAEIESVYSDLVTGRKKNFNHGSHAANLAGKVSLNQQTNAAPGARRIA